MDEQNISFSGELMLLSWAESSTRGRTVTFLVDEDGESHPFKDFTIKSGKRAGQRFMAVLVQVGEDERPVEQHRTAAQQAFVLCRDSEFWEWADERSFDHIASEESARQFILNMFQIKSRGDLDRDEGLSESFKNRVAIPFEAFKRTRLSL